MKSLSSSHTRLSILALVALVCVIYANTLFNGFTIDDPFLYSNNAFVQDLRGLPHLFNSNYFTYSGEASYRPLCTLSLFVDAALWFEWSGGPHLHNLILYVLIVLVVYRLALALTGSTTASFVAAVLFAVHPVHTEAVNNITFREDLHVALLLPLSWLLYRRGRSGHRWLWMPAAWAAYFLGTLSKESAIVFPVAVLLLEWAGGRWSTFAHRESAVAHQGREDKAAGERGGGRELLIYVSGLIVITTLFLFIRFRWLQFPLEAANPQLGGSLLGTLMADVKIQAWYLFQAFVPIHLSALYPASFYTPRVDVQFIVSLVGLLLVAGAFFRGIRSRIFVFGFLWWFMFLAPVANVYPIFNPMAERYVFLPSMGLCIWISSLLCSAGPVGAEGPGWGGWGPRVGRPRPWVLLLVAWTSVMCVIVVHRNTAWRDNLTLWRATARAVKDDATVTSNLAAAYFEVGDFPRVIKHGRRTLELAGRQEGGHFNPAATYVALSGALFMQGEKGEALEYLLKAEGHIPCRFDIDAAIYRNIGLIYDDAEKLEQATQYYLKAIDIDPYRSGLWRKLSFCHLRLGQREDAAKEWGRARELNGQLPPFSKIEEIYQQSQSGT